MTKIISILLFFIVFIMASANQSALDEIDKAYTAAAEKDWAKMKQHFENACDQGNSFGCDEVGKMYELGGYGQVASKDLSRAKIYYAKSIDILKNECNSNTPYSCYMLGDAYKEGKIVNKSESKANKYYNMYENNLLKQCKKDNADGCYHLGNEYLDGDCIKQDIPKAINYLKKACDLKNIQACYELVRIYGNNKYSNKDTAKSIKYLTEACEIGSNYACGRLGSLYKDGKLNYYHDVFTAKKDISIALKYFEKGCDLEHSKEGDNLSLLYSCCYQIGSIYEDGNEIKQDASKALAYYHKACNNNYRWTCDVIGYAYKNGTGIATSDSQILEQNYEKAVEYFRIKCNEKNGYGCGDLGLMYKDGQGVKQDSSRAFNLIKSDCDAVFANGENESCYNVAKMYINGEGTTINHGEAVKYLKKICKQRPSYLAYDYQKEACYTLSRLHKYDTEVKDYFQYEDLQIRDDACSKGAAITCFELGFLYGSQPENIQTDNFKAAMYYQKSCDNDSAIGCYWLGMRQAIGKGMLQDYSKAIISYKKACEGNYIDGCISAGDLYERGLGVNMDKNLAKKYYAIACNNKSEEGCKEYSRLNKSRY